MKCFKGDKQEPFPSISRDLIGRYVMVKRSPHLPRFDERFINYGYNKVEFLTEQSFHNALFKDEWVSSFPCKEAPDLDIEGTLWGGNLSMIVSLLGTPYFPDIEGGILFLEDCNDRAYRIDRNLSRVNSFPLCPTRRCL